MLIYVLLVFMVNYHFTQTEPMLTLPLTEVIGCFGTAAYFTKGWHSSTIIQKTVPTEAGGENSIPYWVNLANRETITVNLACSNKGYSLNISHMELAIPRYDREWCIDIAVAASKMKACQTQIYPCDCCTMPSSISDPQDATCSHRDLDILQQVKDSCDGQPNCEMTADRTDLAHDCSDVVDYICETSAGSQCLARWIKVGYYCVPQTDDPTDNTTTSTEITTTPTKTTLTIPSTGTSALLQSKTQTSTISQTKPSPVTHTPPTARLTDSKTTSLNTQEPFTANSEVSTLPVNSKEASTGKPTVKISMTITPETDENTKANLHTPGISFEFYTGLVAGIAFILLAIVILMVFRKKRENICAKKENSNTKTDTTGAAKYSDSQEQESCSTVTTTIATVTMSQQSTPPVETPCSNNSAYNETYNAKCHNKAIQNVYLEEEIGRVKRSVSDGALIVTRRTGTAAYREVDHRETLRNASREEKELRYRITKSTTVIDENHYEEVSLPTVSIVTQSKMELTSTHMDCVPRDNTTGGHYEDITLRNKRMMCDNTTNGDCEEGSFQPENHRTNNNLNVRAIPHQFEAIKEGTFCEKPMHLDKYKNEGYLVNEGENTQLDDTNNKKSEEDSFSQTDIRNAGTPPNKTLRDQCFHTEVSEMTDKNLRNSSDTAVKKPTDKSDKCLPPEYSDSQTSTEADIELLNKELYQESSRFASPEQHKFGRILVNPDVMNPVSANARLAYRAHISTSGPESIAKQSDNNAAVINTPLRKNCDILDEEVENSTQKSEIKSKPRTKDKIAAMPRNCKPGIKPKPKYTGIEVPMTSKHIAGTEEMDNPNTATTEEILDNNQLETMSSQYNSKCQPNKRYSGVEKLPRTDQSSVAEETVYSLEVFSMNRKTENITDVNLDSEADSPYLTAAASSVTSVEYINNKRTNEDDVDYLKSVDFTSSPSSNAEKQTNTEKMNTKHSRAKSLQENTLRSGVNKRPKSFGGITDYLSPVEFQQSPDSIQVIDLGCLEQEESPFLKTCGDVRSKEGDYCYAYAHFPFEGRTREPHKNESKV